MPSTVNGIPYALPADKLASWSTTSKNLAQWIDGNMLRDDDPRLTTLGAKADVEPVELGYNADANTLTIPGQYVETSATHAGSSTNFPEQRAGVLDVTANADRLHVWQLWRPYAGNRLYMRSRTGGTWSLWEQIVTATDPQLTALADRLTALEYDSGERNITSLLPGVVSGALHLWREGRTVWLDFRDLIVADQGTPGWITLAELLPIGFRPARSFQYVPLSPESAADAKGPVRLRTNGDVLVYGMAGGLRARGTVSFPTPNAPPSSPPGSPA